MDVLEKALHRGLTLPSPIQDIGVKLWQLRKEINVKTLHKLLKMMPKQMHVIVKVNGGSIKY